MTAMDNTMGALLISVIMGGIFYGVSCSQVYYYYTWYSNDPWSLKLLVLAVWTSDSIHQGLISHSIYWYLVTEYGNPGASVLLASSVYIQMFFQAFTGLLVQSYFTMRVWRLSRHKLYLVIPVALMVAAEFILSMAYVTIALTRLQTFSDLDKIKNLSICMNIFAAAPDVTIAAILCTILHTSRTGFSKSNTLINKLMMFAVSTGLLTSICACMSLITFLILPNTLVYICFYFLIGRLYLNSLMAALNARKIIDKGDSFNDASISLRHMHPSNTASKVALSQYSVGPRGNIAIRIDTKKEMMQDHKLTDNDVGPTEV